MTCRCPCGRTPTCSRCPLRGVEAGRRAPGASVLGEPRRAGGLAAVFHGLRAPAAARHGISSGFLTAVQQGKPDHRLRRWRADPRLHVRRRHRRRDHGGGDTGPSGQRVQYWRRLPGHAESRPGSDCTVTGKPVTIQREPEQKGDMRHTYADTSLARRDLGFAPRVSLERRPRAAISVAHK